LTWLKVYIKKQQGKICFLYVYNLEGTRISLTELKGVTTTGFQDDWKENRIDGQT
jgi:hypothetical protein